MKIAIFSFFSGIGLLDLGFEDEGYTIVFVNELHAPFMNAYQANRIDRYEPEFGYHIEDISIFLRGKAKGQLAGQIAAIRRKGDIVGFIGGPPCPDFSVAGKNKGRHGENGALSQTYFNLITNFKPDFFLFENVKGLWKTQIHRTFYEELKLGIQQNGYTTADKLINSIWFGTPQNRERVLLFGVANNLVNDLQLDILSIDEERGMNLLNFPWVENATYRNKTESEYLWPTKTPFIENSKLAPPVNIPQDLTVEHWFHKNEVYNHPNSDHFFQPRSALSRFYSIPEGDDSRKSFKRLHRWRYSPTAAYGHNEVHLHPYKPRRLSVAESLAIQSAPKNFYLPDNLSLSDMFRGVGNGVPYLAGKCVAKSIKDFLLATV